MIIETMKVLVVEPEKEPYVKEISNGLSSLQKEVGGFIEAVYPFEDPVAIICNEEGKLEGLPLNRALRDEDGHVYDIIAGTFLIAGLSEDNFCSLDDVQMEKYSALYKTPELFMRLGNRTLVIPAEEKPKPDKEKKSMDMER
ncbi:MAG: DUF3846 domain-containing protein [Oscillospiraceae bacterium]|nr:DUF3846 domain-containing protein [Oscillospiraceae bacterium]